MMNSVTVPRSQYNTWLKVLYNQESLQPRLWFIVTEFPRTIITHATAIPEGNWPRSKTIYFQWTGRGYRCSERLTIVDDMPCPALPNHLQSAITNGYKAIQQLTQELNQKPVTANDVIKAALAELQKRHPSN
ncbi:hypothetical protein GCM10028805_60240 [Spirosoma harenae]